MENKVLNDNEIVIIDENNNEYLMNILFTYENEDRNSKYVFVYDKSDEESVYAFKYNENGELIEIEDEDELEEVNEVLEAYNNDELFQEIK